MLQNTRVTAFTVTGYFEANWNDIKNTWKEIKSLISLKSVASSVPTILSLCNDETIINPYDIANTFNNYFASVAETSKNIRYSHKDFSDILRMNVAVQHFCNLPIKNK